MLTLLWTVWSCVSLSICAYVCACLKCCFMWEYASVYLDLGVNLNVCVCVCFLEWQYVIMTTLWVSCGCAWCMLHICTLHLPFLHILCLLICCAHLPCFSDTLHLQSLACHRLAFSVSSSSFLFVSGSGRWPEANMLWETGRTEGTAMSGMWGGAGEGANLCQPLWLAEESLLCCTQSCIAFGVFTSYADFLFNITFGLHLDTN